MKKEDKGEVVFVYIIPGFKNRKGSHYKRHCILLYLFIHCEILLMTILVILKNSFFSIEAPWAHLLKNAILKYNITEGNSMVSR